MSPKMEAVIAALLEGKNYGQAAQTAGVCAKTVQRWLKRTDFQAAYEEARQHVLDDAIGHLKVVARKAADTLESSLNAEKDTDKIRAALGILGLVIPSSGRIELTGNKGGPVTLHIEEETVSPQPDEPLKAQEEIVNNAISI